LNKEATEFTKKGNWCLFSRSLITSLLAADHPQNLWRPIGILKQNLSIFETVAAGLREERELELQYRKLDAKRPELRRVQPLLLICVENQWYLRAWDLVRRDLRSFHLARISQAKKLPHRFRVASQRFKR
jgi:predicted DNA-binding transcriptional regulator YafY